MVDAILGDGTGHDLADELKSAGRIERVLYVSGYTENSVVRQGVVVPRWLSLKSRSRRTTFFLR